MSHLPGSGGSYVRDDAGQLVPADQPAPPAPPETAPPEKSAPKKTGLKET